MSFEIFRQRIDSNKEQKKVNPQKVIKEAIGLMSVINKIQDEVGMKRWEDKLNEYGLSGSFEDIFSDLKLASKNITFYALKNPSKVKNIISNFSDIDNFLISEKERLGK